METTRFGGTIDIIVLVTGGRRKVGSSGLFREKDPPIGKVGKSICHMVINKVQGAPSEEEEKR